MYIQDFIGDPTAVIDTAFASPKLHPKKSPGIEAALREVNNALAKSAVAAIAKEVFVDLMDAIAMYEINNGEYSEIPEDAAAARSDYESGLDDVVEAALEKYEAHLSADWLGRSTVDTGLWESSDADRSLVEAFATSAAKEVFKQLTSERTPAQILANAGITRADIEARLAQPEQERKETMTAATELDGVIAKMKEHLGKDFDLMSVYEDVEMIFEEDDEILAGSAASRLGIGKDEMDVLQMAALDMDDAADTVVKLIDTYKPKSGRATTKEAKAAKAEAKAEAEQNGLDASIFTSLKDCGAGDTAMAEALGVSRSTYTNYCKGKTFLVPDADQYDYLREQIVDKANKMLAALAALDGTEPTQVA